MLARIGQFVDVAARPFLVRPMEMTKPSASDSFAQSDAVRIANAMRPLGKCAATVLTGAVLSGCNDTLLGLGLLAGGVVMATGGTLLIYRSLRAVADGVTYAMLRNVTSEDRFDAFLEDRPHKIKEGLQKTESKARERLLALNQAKREREARVQAAEEIVQELKALRRERDVIHKATGRLMVDVLGEKRAADNEIAQALAEEEAALGRGLEALTKEDGEYTLLDALIKARGAAQEEEDRFNAVIARLEKHLAEEVAVNARGEAALALAQEARKWVERFKDMTNRVASRQEVGGVDVPLLTEDPRIVADGVELLVRARAREILEQQRAQEAGAA